jgi:hypothetical protein
VLWSHWAILRKAVSDRHKFDKLQASCEHAAACLCFALLGCKSAFAVLPHSESKGLDRTSPSPQAHNQIASTLARGAAQTMRIRCTASSHFESRTSTRFACSETEPIRMQHVHHVHCCPPCTERGPAHANHCAPSTPHAMRQRCCMACHVRANRSSNACAVITCVCHAASRQPRLCSTAPCSSRA